MKEDTGQILIVDKIVNNNIVIAKDFRGREVVAIGKGVGFRKRKNEAVHRSEIMKTYVLLDKVDSGVLTLFEEIQFEVIETSQKIIDYAQEKLNVKFNVNLLMSLSDHINFALIQYRQGNHVPKLVNEEVKIVEGTDEEMAKRLQTAMGKGAVFAAKVCALEGAFGYGVPILGKTTV